MKSLLRKLSLTFFAIIIGLLSFAQTVEIGGTSYPTITAALAAATDGDIIDITGVHTEVLNLNTLSGNLTISGTDPATDIIQAAAAVGDATNRVITIYQPAAALNMTIENITIRHGNTTAGANATQKRGAGLYVDKNTGLVTLNNVIVEDNQAGGDGGGVNSVNSYLTINNSIIRNNTGGGKGGAIIANGTDFILDGTTVFNNTTSGSGGAITIGTNNVYTPRTTTIKNSLIDSNSASINGGGLFINGTDAKTGIVSVVIENTTMLNNVALKSDGEGGGTIWSKASANNNITLSLVHATLYNNLITDVGIAGAKNGIRFTGAGTTSFSMYNTIAVTADDVTFKAINFGGSSTTDVVNCILGGLEGAPTAIIDDAAKNNSKGKTATFAGFATTLSDEGGNVQVLALPETANAVDYCTAATGITLPTEDARGTFRDSSPDAGAFEFALPNADPVVAAPIADQDLDEGFLTKDIDLTNVFTDGDGDALTLSVSVTDESIVTAEITSLTLTITEVGTGSTTISVVADDGKGGVANDEFMVTVNAAVNTNPTVAQPIDDKLYEAGFSSATVDLTNVFTDANGDALTYSAVALDEAVVTAVVSGTILTITEVANGTTTITVTADDGKGGTVDDEFTAVVNTSPAVDNPIADQAFDEGFGSGTVDLTNVFSDADGDAFTLSVAVTDESVVTAAIDGNTLTLTEVGSGATLVTVSAEDTKGGIGEATFTASVAATSGSTVSIEGVFYGSIALALEAAIDGDIIDIAGIHTESISIYKSVTLRGTDPATDIIQAAESQASATDRVIFIGRPDGSTDNQNVTIENLGIRYGNSAENGGGIYGDKLQGLLTLKNLIIEENATAKNGGGVSIAGSNADIIECTIINNLSALDGAGIILAPNNGVTIDSEINIIRSLIDNNAGRNGGGIFINGNKDFGNNHLIDVYIENTTISNNSTSSPSGGAGGGAIWSKCALWTGDNTTGNITLEIVHATMYNNSHTSAIKNGLQFTSAPAGGPVTNFSMYNSIVVSQDDLTQKAVNFANTNVVDLVNNYLGGLNAAPAIVDDVAKNNAKGKTATEAGLATELTDEGGAVKVLKLVDGAATIDYCTADVTITLPTDDARGEIRDAVADAGAYESVIPNTDPIVKNPIADQVFDEGFVTTTLDLSMTFEDPDGDALTLTNVVDNENIVTASLSGTTLTITEVGTGTTTITITADDSRGGTVSDEFSIRVGANNAPIVATPLDDQLYQVGFTSDNVDLTNTFEDPDGDVFTLSVAIDNEAVITAAINGTTLTLTEIGAGTATVAVTADDGNGGKITEEFLVTVNTAPVLANPLDDLQLSQGFVSQTIDLTNVFIDADGDALTFTSNVSDEMVVTASIDEKTLSLAEVGAGLATVTITADDGNGGIVTDDFTIDVSLVLLVEEMLSEIAIYPNPADLYLKVEANDERVYITNANGVRTEHKLENGEINISGLDAGVYILNIPSSNKTARFIKQ